MPISDMVGSTGAVCVTPATGNVKVNELGVLLRYKDLVIGNVINVNCADSKHNRFHKWMCYLSTATCVIHCLII